MDEVPHTRVFEAGYDKGRADGLAQAVTLIQIAIDYFPQAASEHARGIVPNRESIAICSLIHNFGDRCYRAGVRDQKKKSEKSAISGGS